MDSVHTQQTCGPACLQTVDELVQLARKLNQQRSPDHRERISAAVASVREYFRDGPAGELLSSQASPLLARVTALDWACDASPEGYALAIDALAVLASTRPVTPRNGRAQVPHKCRNRALRRGRGNADLRLRR